MEPESLKHNQHLQMNLDKLRAQEGYDFGGIALYDYHHTSSPLNGNMFQVTQMIDINLSF